MFSSFFNRKNTPIVEGARTSFFSMISANVGTIDSDTAMRHSTVFACVQIIVDALATVTLNTYTNADNKKTTAKDHPLYKLLKTQPNKNMTSFVWRQLIYRALLLRGNHYSQVIRNGLGEVVALYPLFTDRMEVMLSESGEKVFVYTTSKGVKAVLTKDEVLHIIAIPDESGLIGINPIEYNRKAIDLSATTEQFGINFFKNGANAGGIIKHPQTLSNDAKQRLTEDFDKAYSGVRNSSKTLVFEEGMTFEKLTISNNDSQFLETRAYQKGEIASIFKVPLYMLGDLSKATFNNMEQLNTNFVINTLMPWAVRFEQAVLITLIDEDDQDEYYVKFNLNSLMRGDFKTRTEGYKTMVNMGAMTPDEVRKYEELDPKGGDADKLYMQLNMAPLENLQQGSNNENN